MTQTLAITKDIQWIGVLDKDLRVFDIIMETKYGTTYNSYVIKTSEGAVLVETVKERFFEPYIEHVKSVVGDLSNIKYLITNHTEPDHAGSIAKVLNLIPQCTVIGSKTAISYLQDIMNISFNYRTAESLGQLSFGGKTFQFISVPFLHWPDSMYTYLPEEETIFTCDSFGAHYSPKKSIKLSELPESEELEYQDGFQYYYAAIFGPFKSYVLKGLEKIKDLKIKNICNGHGPVLDCRIEEILGKYRTMSTVEVNHPHKTVVMPYVSAYGYTEEIAIAIEKGIKEVDSSIEVTRTNINAFNYGELKPKLLQDIQEADGVLLGTCTINGDALPPIWDLALSMNPITHGGKVASAFGSYGWSGEGVDNIMDRLNQLRLEVVDGLKIKFRASEKETQQAMEFGQVFGKAVIDGKAPPSKTKKVVTALNWEELNPEGKVVFWRCVVCGEIFKGVSPPLICPACGVGQECFELYEPEEISFKSTTKEEFVIIGSGIAGLSAAESIRSRNVEAKITILSGEKSLPYRRPALSDLLMKDLPFEELYLHTNEWYAENKIDVVLGVQVNKIDSAKQTVLYAENQQIHYDKLILATGSCAFVPPLQGNNLKGVYSIKFKETVEEIREFSKGKKNAVVIGGGVLGLEAVDALLHLGLTVDVFECAPRIMPRQLDECGSKVWERVIRNKGINLHIASNVNEIIGTNGQVSAVRIGEITIPCDLVIINIGVRACVDLAKEAGVNVNRGIIVNDKCQTTDPNIYAAGDCAEFMGMGIQLWEVAIEMGRVAGANAVGDSKTFNFAIYPVSMIGFDTDMCSIGSIPTCDLENYHIYSDIDEKIGYYRKFYFKDDKLVAGIMIGDTQSKFNLILKGVKQGHSYQKIMSEFFA